MKNLCAFLTLITALFAANAAFALPSFDEASSLETLKPAAKNTGNVAAQPNAKFVCPNAEDKTALSCFLNATAHLYAVCSRVKAIEMNEFGYDRSEEGGNGFKSEFCREKQRATLPLYYNAAMKDATDKYSCEVIADLDELHAMWQTLLSGIRPYANEPEAQYRHRVEVVREAFEAYRVDIKAAVARGKDAASTKQCYIAGVGANAKAATKKTPSKGVKKEK